MLWDSMSQGVHRAPNVHSLAKREWDERDTPSFSALDLECFLCFSFGILQESKGIVQAGTGPVCCKPDDGRLVLLLAVCTAPLPSTWVKWVGLTTRSRRATPSSFPLALRRR